MVNNYNTYNNNNNTNDYNYDDTKNNINENIKRIISVNLYGI